MIFFNAAWSAPGRLMEPTLARIARAYGWPFLRLEVAAWPELLKRYEVKTLPELILAHGEKVLGRWRGFYPEGVLRTEIEGILKGGTDDGNRG